MAKSKTTPKTPKTKGQTVSDMIVPNTTFTLTITAEKIKIAEQKAVVRAQKVMKLDGFRPGKVPLKIVQERLGAQGLTEMALEEVLPQAYEEAIAAHKYAPLIDPEVMPKKMQPGEDWEFEVSIAQMPELELGEYQAIAKKVETPEIPPHHHDHGDDHDHSEEEKKQARLQAVLAALLEKTKVMVPELLLRKETEHRLRHLENQLTQVGLKLEQYLENIKKTKEELEQEYAVTTLASLQVELLLAAIIRTEKLTIDQKQLEDLVKLRLESRKEKTISREEVTALQSSLLKQAAIDHLLAL